MQDNREKLVKRIAARMAIYGFIVLLMIQLIAALTLKDICGVELITAGCTQDHLTQPLWLLYSLAGLLSLLGLVWLGLIVGTHKVRNIIISVILALFLTWTSSLIKTPIITYPNRYNFCYGEENLYRANYSTKPTAFGFGDHLRYAGFPLAYACESYRPSSFSGGPDNSRSTINVETISAKNLIIDFSFYFFVGLALFSLISGRKRNSQKKN